MNLAYLLNNIKVAESKRLPFTFVPYSKLAATILQLMKNNQYIGDFEKENYKIKVQLNNKIKKIYSIKPRVGLNSEKLFKLFKNIYLGCGHLIITNSFDGVCLYDPSLKMAGVPLLYVSI